MRKPKPCYGFAKEGKYGEKGLIDAGWLILSKHVSKKRNKFHIRIPEYQVTENFGSAVSWTYPNRTVPERKRVKREVIDFFDPAGNREVNKYFYSVNGKQTFKWKFRDLDSAEQLFALALLKWPDNSWMEDDVD